MPATIHHALVLNLHQPSGNLEELLSRFNPEGEDGWEGKEILYAYDRIARSLWPYEDLARVHLACSGTLLETLANPVFQEKTYGIVKCGEMLWHWQNHRIIEMLGTGYYHPVLPLIPPADWEQHVARWRSLAQHLFWRDRFAGFWPPELGFCMELIPLLERLGYEYVVVDSENVRPLDPMDWATLRYRPHWAEHAGRRIVVVVRDRQLSDAQLSGMEPEWFLREVAARTAPADFEPLVLTATDGDNGGWFRNFRDRSNFWNAFYQPLLDGARRGEHPVRPCFIGDYIREHGVHGRVHVESAAWNTGWHHGQDFQQWTGSPAQQAALARVRAFSAELHEVLARLPNGGPARDQLEQAHWRLLRAETSCNFFWGEAWVEHCLHDLDAAAAILAPIAQAFPPDQKKEKAARKKESKGISPNPSRAAPAAVPMV
jgi:hypothetical protein